MSGITHEFNLLKEAIKRLGTKDESTGKYTTTFGTLINDTQVFTTLEELPKTLRAAKLREIVSYEGELEALLQRGVHDKVAIVLMKPDYRGGRV